MLLSLTAILKTLLSFAAMIAGGIIFQGELWDLREWSYRSISGNILIGTTLILGGLAQLWRE